ncbi:McrB family protein [Metabacillus iocasae]|uniref:Energy-coupling factor transporter ATP-binding protein EcfA2 n=1 Tax=Priestia iocasae TaxID=2291674 RepID=A0ABS2QWC5_9BACI|nr:DUF3578 domain-containing protein [Metabacillus iocasae]MBM7703794.1 energy-coupling factor transporter ATP-binding protein EcfA2 [Metabacillus iocasae]
MSLRERLLFLVEHYDERQRDVLMKQEVENMLTRRLPMTIYRIEGMSRENLRISGLHGERFPYLRIQSKQAEANVGVLYIISEDRKRIYLTMMEMASPFHQKEIRFLTPDHHRILKDEDIVIGTSIEATEFEEGAALYIPYNVEDFPTERQLKEDLIIMMQFYEQYLNVHAQEKQMTSDKDLIHHIYHYLKGTGFYYELSDVANVYFSLKTKPFVILSGVSGTGKTKIAQLFAESIGASEDNGQIALLPVRPDWSDSSDLIGYTDLKGEFRKGLFLKMIERALNNPSKPYIIILDEMNVARVEHYLSDILSVIESRKWKEGRIVTYPLLPGHKSFRDVYLPANLFVIGTINMDETTHSFSQKLLDRTNTIEFNTIKLDAFDFLLEEEREKPSTQVIQLQSQFLHLKDVYHQYRELVQEITIELIKINDILAQMDLQIGYRVRDEVCFYMVYAIKSGMFTFDQAFDFQILQKVLPRIGGSDYNTLEGLKELYHYSTSTVLDEVVDTAILEAEQIRFPKSGRKLMDMIKRFDRYGYTSFWASTTY